MQEMLTPLQVKLVGINAGSRLLADPCLFIDGQLRTQCRRNPKRNIGLYGKDVRQLAVIGFRPEWRSVAASISSATIRTSAPAMVCRLWLRCLNGITDVRDMTRNARIFERAAMTSSVTPSAKYSFSESALRFRKGMTQ